MKRQKIMIAGTAIALSATVLASAPHYLLQPKNQEGTSAKISSRFSAKGGKHSGERLPFTPQAGMSVAAAGHKAPMQADALTTLYGAVIYNDDWYDDLTGNFSPQYGYHAFTPSSNISLTPICIHDNLYINGGGAYSDRKIHYHLWEMYADEDSETGIVFHNYYCVVNTDTWSFENIVDYSNNETNISYDMTYEPVSNKLYALEWGTYDSGYCDLAEIGLTNGESNVLISKIPEMVCLASDNFGNLYSVGRDGKTYYINPATKELIVLGDTGVSPRYSQSATVDPTTNTIYWAATLEDETGALYTLDTTTGKATKVGGMPGNAEVTGLFVEADAKGMNAPAAVDNLTLSYEGGKSVISLNLPTKGFDGSAITGSVTAELYIDGKAAGSQTGSAGDAVSFSNSVTDGNHTVVVYARNEDGIGAKSIRNQYCGNDVPEAVGDLTLTVTDGTASLTWTAPTQGAHGGSLDSSTLNYTVTRYPGTVKVAEGLTDTSFSESLPSATATYYYTVTAYAGEEAGETATSNSYYSGVSMTLPYYNSFDTAEAADGFTLLSSEGRGWYWWNNSVLGFQAMACKFNMEKQCDEWMILPGFDLVPGQEYTLSFDAWVFDSDSPERFEVKMGMGNTPEVQTKTLVATHTITNDIDNIKRYSVPFTVDQEGNYNIGFHSTQTAKVSYYLLIDNIRLEEGVVIAYDKPCAVTDVKAEYNTENGNVEVSWKAPTKDLQGHDLKAENITYKVLDSYGQQVCTDLKETHLTDNRFASDSRQAFVYYQVHAIHAGLESEGTLCDFVMTGEDNEVPFRESFAEAGLDNTPWALSRLAGSSTSTWTIGAESTGKTAAEPQDGDGGMTIFMSATMPAGVSARLTSPKIDLTYTSHPVLSFYVNYAGGGNDKLKIQMAHNDNEYTDVQDITLPSSLGWQLVKLELPREQCAAQSQIAFTATAGGYGPNICIDNINVYDDASLAKEIDLAATNLILPEELMVGETGDIMVDVTNVGTTTVDKYVVKLLCDGMVVLTADNDEPIEPGDTYRCTFKATADQSDYLVTYKYRGCVATDGDEDPSNDMTAEKELTIGVSAVQGIDAEGNRVMISANEGSITVTGAEGKPVMICNASGAIMIKAIGTGNDSYHLEKGIYLVKAGKLKAKLLVK